MIRGLPLILLLTACGPSMSLLPPSPDRCNQFALMTYAREDGGNGWWSKIVTEKVCIVAMRPLER